MAPNAAMSEIVAMQISWADFGVDFRTVVAKSWSSRWRPAARYLTVSQPSARRQLGSAVSAAAG